MEEDLQASNSPHPNEGSSLPLALSGSSHLKNILLHFYDLLTAYHTLVQLPSTSPYPQQQQGNGDSDLLASDEIAKHQQQISHHCRSLHWILISLSQGESETHTEAENNNNNSNNNNDHNNNGNSSDQQQEEENNRIKDLEQRRDQLLKLVNAGNKNVLQLTDHLYGLLDDLRLFAASSKDDRQQ